MATEEQDDRRIEHLEKKSWVRYVYTVQLEAVAQNRAIDGEMVYVLLQSWTWIGSIHGLNWIG